MEPRWTEVFLQHPWLAALAWAVLHSADYFLTLWGASLHQAGAGKVVSLGGSFELNPLFRTTIDRLKLLSLRFLLSLFLVGMLLYALAWLTSRMEARESTWGLSFVLGALLFTRAAVIVQHLNGIWLYRRMLRKDSPITGSISYDRRTIYLLAAWRFCGSGALLALAAVLSPGPWLLGGLVGCGGIAAWLLLLGLLTPGRAAGDRPAG